jgi:hypothetical protein
MLQLDSTFSERTYGASTFRDFAEKLASAGVVTLKESGRNILVELKDEHHHVSQAQPVSTPAAATTDEPHQPHHGHGHQQPAAGAPRPAEAVAEVRRLFQNAQQPPRWPMYVRQMKQYLRGVDPTFEERKFGFQSLNDLLRACQKDGLFRMERDRQGVIRFFQGNVMKEAESARAHGSIDAADIAAAERLAAQAEAELAAQERREAEVVEGDVVRETEAPAIVDGEEAPVSADSQQPAADTTAPGAEPEKGRRKRPASAKAPKAAKAPREKKSVAKPKTSRRKVAVAADA